MRGVALLPLLLLGCGPKDPVDSASTTATGVASGSPGTGSASGTPTGTTLPSTGTPTGTPTTGFEPTQYRVAYGWFGVQSGQAGPVDDVDLFGTPIQTPIQIAIRLGDDTIEQGPTPTNHCDVVLTTTDTLPAAAWTADAGWFAVQLPPGASVSDSNCDFPMAPGWTEPGARVSAHAWGMAVRTLEPDDLSAWGGYGTTDPLQGKLLGGSWWTDVPGGTAGGGTLGTPGIAIANQLDAGQIARDANHDKQPLDAAAVPTPGGVTDAFYELFPLSPWRDAGEL